MIGVHASHQDNLKYLLLSLHNIFHYQITQQQQQIDEPFYIISAEQLIANAQICKTLFSTEW